ncbi:MAG: hypothetical protein IT430_08500 [Phycisphaerales bacterium]|nr:hypothetical protein [Phycisphaerales bacterium]
MISSHSFRVTGAFVLALLALLAAGCDTTKAPRIDLVSARVVEQRPEASLVELTLELTNDNPDPVPLVEFNYSASLDGHRLIETRRAAQATLRRLGTQSIVLPVVIPAGAAGGPLAGVHALVVSGKLSYIAPGQLGEVLFDTGVRVPTVSFTESVTVEFGSADGS